MAEREYNNHIKEPKFRSHKGTIKILFFGLTRAGKTAILYWLFNKVKTASDMPSRPTIDYNRYSQRINDSELTLFDLAGPTAFLDRFMGELAEFIFSGAKTIVFVVDSIDLKDISRVKYYLDLCIKNVERYSPNASIIIFQHKIDLIPDKLRQEVFHTTKDYLLKDIPRIVPYFETTLFSSSIVVAMAAVYQATLGYIPNNVIPDYVVKTNGK